MVFLRVRIYLLLAILVVACNNSAHKQDQPDQPVLEKAEDKPIDPQKADTQIVSQSYSNERFKDVTVEKLEPHKFRIKGKAQVFEATFSWIVEDGHEELGKGFQMTNAGAPEWGEFMFAIDIQKKRSNSTLHLILFESSPKDGSRQFELPVLLY